MAARLLLALLLLALALPGAARAQETAPKRPTASGTGGAAASVDALATQAAVRALRGGANAVDAAVVAAAVLGVTEPYSCGIGGGGFMVLYRAADARVRTIDSREAAPDGFTSRSLLDPATGRPLPFAEAVTSGLSVGVPGTVRGWEEALARFGTLSLRQALAPAVRVARRGFVVDETFAQQTRDNLERFRAFTSTRALFLEPDGTEPDPGDVLRNPDLAATYERIGRRGSRAFYLGPVATDIVDAARRPPVAPGTTRTVRPGLISRGDLADYDVQLRRPTRVGYRGLDVYGMGPPSSGGSTVGEALDVLEGFDLRALGREGALHRYLEASKLAFADRNAYVGDPEYVDVPLAGLLSDSFAAERRALIGERALPTPVGAGDPFDDQDDPSPSGPPRGRASVARNGSTTHLTVSDRRGDVVAYTFTIEQTGGSGIVVPGRGFLLNNELTDFEFSPPAPNAPEGTKRPRSSIAPTIVLQGGRPILAVGSPGGASIITTVLQVLVERLDLGRSLPQAIAAPRASQRNGVSQAEPAFLAAPETGVLLSRGHTFTPIPELGAATGIELQAGGRVVAAAEPTRRGGGAAAVERPAG